MSARGPVDGTPRWAVVTAWLCVACVAPSGLRRTAVGLGVDLGWSQEHLDLERIPGYGTLYVITLTVLSLAAAALALGLVYPWGDRVPRWVPVLRGRRVPTTLVVVLGVAGAAAVAWIVVLSIVHWSSVSGFADRPDSGWARLMLACYLPATLWAPLLLATLAAYVARRRRQGPATNRWRLPRPPS